MAHAKIDEALELFYGGDTAGAQVLLQEVGDGKLEPPAELPPLDEAAFHEALGGIRLAAQDAPGAIVAFRRMIELEVQGSADPGGHATSHAKLAEALAVDGQFEESLALFDKALQMKEQAGAQAGALLGMLYRYADVLFHRGRYKEAAEKFERALQLAENSDVDPATLANLALYHAEALKHYTAPLFLSVRMQKEMQGASPPPQVALLEKQLEGQYRQAITGFQRAAELARNARMDDTFSLQIQRSMAEMHHDASRFVKAVMARKKLVQQAEAMKVEPRELAFMLHGLGESTKEMNQPAEAAESFRKAISLKEKSGADGVSQAKTWYALGECLGASRKLESALEAFQKALGLEEAAAATDENRKSRMKKYAGAVAQVLQVLGKADEAKAAQEKANAV